MVINVAEVFVRLSLVAVVLVLSACGRAPTPQPEVTAAPPPPSDALVDSMHSNLSLTATAHTALMRGDLAGAKEAASGLASKPRIEGLPEPWMDNQVALRVKASEVSEAADLAAGATALSKVARACGDCHAFVGVGPKFYAVPAPPAEGEDVPAHMKYHAWLRTVVGQVPELVPHAPYCLSGSGSQHLPP